MKTTLNIFFLICSFFCFSQEITGDWHGSINTMGSELMLTFNITKSENSYSGTMSVPQQKAFGIPLSKVTFENETVTIELDAAKLSYVGKRNSNNEFEGTFSQNGQMFPLNLSRNKKEEKKINRPQDPKEPFPYTSEEVTFENPSAKITLAGTLTLPKTNKPCPVVVLISGSGPQNRNSELFNHKPFWVLADYLTRKGIGVLRVDDRGVGKSTGNRIQATTLDFATDTEAAVTFLKTRKDINPKKIGLIGHSEGGMIAPIVASKDKSINLIVLLAGPGVPCDQLLIEQSYLIGKSDGLNETELEQSKKLNQSIYSIVKSDKTTDEVIKEIEALLEKSLSENPDSNNLPEAQKKEMISQQAEQITSPWFRYFLKFNPDEYVSKVKCPVLILNGGKDLQVPAKMNTEGIQKSLAKGGNKKSTTIIYPSMNHLFQECTTGGIDEYGTIEQTISPQVLNDLSNWILEHTK